MENCKMFSLFVFVLMLKLSSGGQLDNEVRQLFRRNDLECPDECLKTKIYEEPMKCCVCESKPHWLSDLSQLYSLILTFLDPNGIPMVTEMFPSDDDMFAMIHQNGNLTMFPANMCNYSTTVYIDLSFNEIEHIENISCMHFLDTLNLTGNNISYLNQSTFSELKFLRVFDLSYNKLRHIEPGLLYNMNGSLAYFNVSHNYLKVVDVTNVFWDKQKHFCVSNFSNNEIEKITNVLNWTCENAQALGHGGYVDFKYNNFMYFFDYEQIGFADITCFGKAYYYSFDIRFNKWICDCKFYPFIIKSNLAVNIVKREHVDLKCNSPKEMKGKLVKEFTVETDLLICNISLAEKCPTKCRCYYQPSKNSTIVQCRSSLVTSKLPLVLPDYNNLVVDFSQNELYDLETDVKRILQSKSNYLKRIKEISFAHNKIHLVSNFIIAAFNNISKINLEGNFLERIPEAIKAFHPCNIILGTVKIKCSCSDTWLQTWLSFSGMHCHNNTKVFCQTSDGLKSVINMSKEELGCASQNFKWINFGIGIFVTAAFSLVIMLYVFPTEIYILVRRGKTSNGNYPSFTYDVYISCDEHNDDLRQWISCSLMPLMSKKNLRVFLPYKDCILGSCREEEIINVMSNAENYLIILSDTINDSTTMWVQHEWKHAWTNYCSDRRKNIIIINYDLLKQEEISNRHIKAFVRLGKYLDFSNHDHQFENKVMKMVQSRA